MGSEGCQKDREHDLLRRNTLQNRNVMYIILTKLILTTFHFNIGILTKYIANFFRLIRIDILKAFSSPYLEKKDTLAAIVSNALAIVREIGDIRGEGSILWNMSLALDILCEAKAARMRSPSIRSNETRK